MPFVFERFTEGARQVVVLAQEEARKLRHRYIGSEHLLLGIAREGGAGAMLLAGTGVGLDDIRARVIPLAGPPWSSKIPFTRRARAALEHALRASLALGDARVGSEHLLLGVLADPKSAAAQLLADLGVGAEAIRAAIAAERGSMPAGPGTNLDYDAVVSALREWEGQMVTAIRWPTAAAVDRPYRGRLEFVSEDSGDDRVTFRVPTDPPGERLGNPTGITFVLRRAELGGAMWVGGPEPGVGLSVILGSSRLAVFPD